MLFVTMLMSLLQYDIGYSKSCFVDPTADIVENAALNKTASQISDYSLLGVASKAVDGNNNPDYFDGSCAHTKYMDPRLYRWWMVDLERVFRIDNLNITNRAGETARKLRDFDIYVSLNSTFKNDDQMTDGFLCFHVSGEMGSGETRTFLCQTPVFGQFVQIYMETPDKRNLHICEVTVQGYPAVCVEDTTTQILLNVTPTTAMTLPEVPTTQSVSNMTPTTALSVQDDPSITTHPACLCRCIALASTKQNLSQEGLVELVKELANELVVNKKETSMSKRKLISVGDERQSAETIGIIGVLALCVPVLLIVSFDLVNLWMFLKLK